MKRLRRVRRVALPVLAIAVLLALAVLAGLVACEARAIERAVEREDLAYVGRPTRFRGWSGEGRVPSAHRSWRVEALPFSERLLGIEEDLLYRRALRAYADDARRRDSSYDFLRATFRAEARRLLGEAERAALPASLRSNAANMQGALTLDEANGNPERRAKLTELSIEHFRRAIRIDPGNEEAKYNLELLLRLPELPPFLKPPDEDLRPRVGSSTPGAERPRRGHGY